MNRWMQNRAGFLPKEESVSFNHATAGIQMWSHLGLGLGTSRGPQAASLYQVGSSTWGAESRFLPILEIDPSGIFFHKAATAVLRYFFHHGRLPPQRWVQGRVRLAGMRTSSLLLGFCAGKGLLLQAAMTRGKRLTETFRLVAI